MITKDVLVNCGKAVEVLVKEGNFAAAEEILKAMAKTFPANDPQCSNFLSAHFYLLGFADEAAFWAKKTVEILPSDPNALFQLGLCANKINEFETAVDAYEKILSMGHKESSIKLNLALNLTRLNKFDDAEKIYQQLLSELPPTHEHYRAAMFNMHIFLLRRGQLHEGAKYFNEAYPDGAPRWNFPRGPRPELKNTQQMQGKTILLLHEAGGAGDEIMEAGFAKRARALGANIIWRTNHQSLAPLLLRSGCADKVIEKSKSGSELDLDFDFWSNTGSLPQVLMVDPKNYHAESYFKPDASFLKKWEEIIPKTNGPRPLRVGLQWRGLSGGASGDAVPFNEYRTLFDIPNIEFYSFQKADGIEEMSKSDPVKDLAPQLQVWDDTAAAVMQMDVMISSCSGVAHLAGALGTKTWIMTPQLGFRLWQIPGDKTIWYKDVYLFRQQRYKRWSDVIQKVKVELTELARNNLK